MSHQWSSTPGMRNTVANDSGLEQTPLAPVRFEESIATTPAAGDDEVPQPPRRYSRFSPQRRRSSNAEEEDVVQAAAAALEAESQKSTPIPETGTITPASSSVNTPVRAPTASTSSVPRTAERLAASSEEARHRLEGLILDALTDQNAALFELSSLKKSVKAAKSSYNSEQNSESYDMNGRQQREKLKLNELQDKLARAKSTKLEGLSSAVRRYWIARAEKRELEVQMQQTHRRLSAVADATVAGVDLGDRQCCADLIPIVRQAHARTVEFGHDTAMGIETSPVAHDEGTLRETASTIETLTNILEVALGAGAHSTYSSEDQQDMTEILKAIGACSSELEMLEKVDSYTENDLEHQIASIKSECNRLLLQYNHLRSELNSASVAARQSNLSQMDVVLATLEKEIKQHDGRERELSAQIQTLQDDKARLELRLNSEAARLKHEAESRYASKEQLDESVEDVTRLSSEISALRQDLEFITQQKHDSDAEKAQLAIQVRELKHQISGLEQQIAREQRARKDVEEHLKRLNGQLAARNTQLDISSADFKDVSEKKQELERLLLEKDLERERLLQQSAKLESQTPTVAEQNESISTDLETSLIVVQDLQLQLHEKTMELDRSILARTELENALKHESIKLAAEKSRGDDIMEQNQELQLDNAKLQKTLSDASHELGELRAKQNETEAMKVVLESRLSEYTAELEDIQSKLMRTKSDDVSKSIAAQYDTLVQTLQQERDKLSVELAKCKADLENTTATQTLELESVQAEVADYKARIENLQEIIDEQRSVTRQLQSDKELSAAMIKTNQETIEQYRAELEGAVQEKFEAVNQATSAAAPSSRLTQVLDELKAAKARIFNLEDELDRTKHIVPVIIGGRPDQDNPLVSSLKAEIVAIQADLHMEIKNREVVEAQLSHLKRRGDRDVEMLRNHAQIEADRLAEENTKLQRQILSEETKASRKAVDEIRQLKAENDKLLRTASVQARSNHMSKVTAAKPPPASPKKKRLLRKRMVERPTKPTKREVANPSSQKTARKRPTFEVSVWPTEVADRLGLSKRRLLFRVDGNSLAAVDPATLKLVHMWPIEHILRYGIDEDTVSLEIGRIGKRTAGIYYLHCEAADELFTAIDERCSIGPGPIATPTKTRPTTNL